MFKWITDTFSKQEKVAHTQPSAEPCPLTRKERLMAILLSYHSGKISLDQAVNLINIWRLSNRP